MRTTRSALAAAILVVAMAVMPAGAYTTLLSSRVPNVPIFVTTGWVPQFRKKNQPFLPGKLPPIWFGQICTKFRAFIKAALLIWRRPLRIFPFRFSGVQARSRRGEQGPEEVRGSPGK